MLSQDAHTAKAPPPRLLVDAMLGRLARWLRLMGYDAAYWRDGSDEALIAAAAAADRLIVTRDHALAGRRGVRALLIVADSLVSYRLSPGTKSKNISRKAAKSQSCFLASWRLCVSCLSGSSGLGEQMAEARAALGGEPQPFTRCGECNGALVGLPHADARDLVPPYVWHTQAEFRRCPDCGRVYWKGTHWPALVARIEEERQG